MSSRTTSRRDRAAGRLALLLGLALLASPARAAVAIPPAPARHFNDYASLVSPVDAQRLDDKLRAFEQENGAQIVVAIFAELPAPSLEDFTVRTAQAWRAGDKKRDNGAVLFVFPRERRTRLEVGYGLEGELPDAIAKRIVQDTLAPHFRRSEYAAGLEAAIDAIIGEIREPGAVVPVAAPQDRAPDAEGGVLVGAFLLLIFFFVVRALSRRGPRGRGGSGIWYTGAGWGSGSGWSSGGGGWSSGGDGGGFSGGGGSFGGGGASGDW